MSKRKTLRENRRQRRIDQQLDQAVRTNKRMFLTYPGDLRDIDLSQSFGPGRGGAWFNAIGADFDPVTDQTRVEFTTVYRPGLGGRVRV